MNLISHITYSLTIPVFAKDMVFNKGEEKLVIIPEKTLLGGAQIKFLNASKQNVLLMVRKSDQPLYNVECGCDAFGEKSLKAVTILLEEKYYADDFFFSVVNPKTSKTLKESQPFQLNKKTNVKFELKEDLTLVKTDLNKGKDVVSNKRPSTPSEVKISEVKASSVKVSWSPSADPDGQVTGYEVSYKESSGSWTGTQTTAQTSLILSGLQPETSYTFRIRTKDDEDAWSDYAESASVKTPVSDNQPPSQPSNISTSQISASSITVSWEASVDSDGWVTDYEVSYQKDNGFWTGTSITSANTYTFYSLQPDTDYTFRVRAKDDAGDWSDYQQSSVVKTAPAKPSSFSISGRTSTFNTESGKSYECSKDGGANFTDCNSPFTFGDNAIDQGKLCVRVKASDNAPASDWSCYSQAIAAKPTKPNAPTGLAISGRTLTFNTESGKSYECSKDGGANFTNCNSPFTFGDNAIAKNKLCVRVKAASNTLVSDWSCYSQAIAATNQTPSKPSTISTSNIQKNSIKISWSAATDSDGSITGYQVSYKVGYYGSWTGTQTTTQTTYTFNSLQSNTTYTFRVRAKDNDNAWSPYKESSATKTLNQPPSKPSTISTSNIQKNSIKISWSSAKDSDGSIAGYEVSYKKGSGAWTGIQTTSWRTYTFYSLKSNTTYTFRVRAKDNDNAWSPYKESSATKTLNQPPSKPSTISTSNIQKTSIKVSWSAATDSDGSIASYQISYKVGYYGSWTGTQTTTQNTYTFSSLQSDKAYTFRVRAKDNDNAWSSYRQSSTVKTKPTKPSNLAVSASSRTFTFARVSGKSYECSKDAGGTANGCSSPFNFGDDALVSGKLCVRVKASGNAPASDWACYTKTVAAAKPRLSGIAGRKLTFTTASGLTYQCSKSGGSSPSDCSTPFAFGDASIAKDTLCVRVKAKNNIPASDWSCYNRAIAPAKPTSLALSGRTLTFATASGLIYQCSKSGGSSPSNCRSPFAFGDAPIQTSKLCVRVKAKSNIPASDWSCYNDQSLTKQWSKLLGTSSYDEGRGVSVDASGNVYVTGDSGNRVLLAKYNSSGLQQWSKSFGSGDGYGVSVDASGNVYATGDSGNRVLLAKYSPSGEKQWSKSFGTSSYDYGYGVSVDSSGNVYVTGRSYGDFDGHSNSGNSDMFLIKFGAASASVGKPNAPSALALSGRTFTFATASGKSYQCSQDGGTNVTDCSSPFSFGDAAIQAGKLCVRVKATGSDPASDWSCYKQTIFDAPPIKHWSMLLGTSSDDKGKAVALDSSGNVYVSGNLGQDMVLTKYDSSGNKQWSQSGNSDDYVEGISVDSSGNIYATGYSSGAFDGQVNSGSSDMFLIKYDSSGTKKWSKLLGTSGDDRGQGVSVDSSGNVYVTGYSYGDFDGHSNSGNSDMFLIKYDSSGTKSGLNCLARAVLIMDTE